MSDDGYFHEKGVDVVTGGGGRLAARGGVFVLLPMCLQSSYVYGRRRPRASETAGLLLRARRLFPVGRPSTDERRTSPGSGIPAVPLRRRVQGAMHCSRRRSGGAFAARRNGRLVAGGCVPLRLLGCRRDGCPRGVEPRGRAFCRDASRPLRPSVPMAVLMAPGGIPRAKRRSAKDVSPSVSRRFSFFKPVFHWRKRPCVDVIAGSSRWWC